MNRRAFLRGLAIIPVGAAVAPLVAVSPREAFDVAARSTVVNEAFLAGTISRQTALSYMGFANFTDVEIEQAIVEAERWMDGLAVTQLGPRE